MTNYFSKMLAMPGKDLAAWADQLGFCRLACSVLRLEWMKRHGELQSVMANEEYSRGRGLTRSGLVRKAFSLTSRLTMAFFLVSGAHSATTYFVDYVNGSDANAGTSTNSPWRRCPRMSGFAGNYTHSAGDRFIFKGGVTWPASVFPMRISVGGSVSSPDYYGIDKTWYSGTAWIRPKFDLQNTEVNPVVHLGASYVMLDGFEFDNIYWSSPGSVNVVLVGSVSSSTIANCYFHNWSHGGAAQDGLYCIWAGGYNSVVVTNCFFDGSKSMDSAGPSGTSDWCTTAL